MNQIVNSHDNEMGIRVFYIHHESHLREDW